MTTDPEASRAFNQGSDSRLAGKPLSVNPYVDPTRRDDWKLGWQHVDLHFGEMAKWPVRPLPEIVSKLGG